MRIISGKFKGKKILEPNDLNTRPLKDLTKESIFNIIKHLNRFNINFENSEILDLFSGTGSFGIECISRGAKFVTFVENYNGILPILKKNLANLKLASNYLVIEKNFFNYLNLNQFKKQFDIIFLDPPYKYKNLSNILDQIHKQEILKKNGIIILHRHKNEKDNFNLNFKLVEKKIYGISKIIFLFNLN